MKHVAVVSLLFTTLIGDIYGQISCKDKAFKQKCLDLLPEGYLFARERKIKIRSMDDFQKNNFWITFEKGNNYLITVCDINDTENQLVVNLYDKNNKLISSSYYEDSGRYDDRIMFSCDRSGTYHLDFRFNGTNDGCGISTVAFLGSNKIN